MSQFVTVLFALIVAITQLPALAQSHFELGTTPPQGISERAGELTLQEALTLSDRYSPVLKAASLEIDATNAAAVQASVYPNPVLSTELEDTRKSTRKTTVLVGIPLEVSGQRGARMSAAASGRTVASAELANARAEVHGNVIQTFFEVVIAQERWTIAQATYELAAKASDVAGKRVAAGKVSPVEETRAQVAQANSALEITDAKSELSAARYALAATWGNSEPIFSKALATLSDVPSRPEWSVLEAKLAKSPQLGVASAEVTRREALAALEQSRSHVIPTLNFGTKRDQELGRTELVIGLSIPLPLFDRNQGNIGEALSRTEKARTTMDATRVRLSTELHRAFTRLNAARESLQSLNSTILPGAERAYKAATRGFEAGKFSFLEVLDAQRTFFQARAQYLTVLANAYAAAAAIDRIVGT